MKRYGLLAALMCAFALCLAFAGCGGASGANESDQAKQAFAGTWDLVGMSQDGGETSADDIAMLSSLGLEVYLNLNEDDTAELVLFGESMTGTWSATSATTGTIELEGDKVDMTIADDQLMMVQDGASLTFAKGEARSDASADAADESSASDESKSGDADSGSSAAA